LKFSSLSIPGPLVVELEQFTDSRGTFARSFCAKEFADAGIHFEAVQENLSISRRAGTVRGMHFQDFPNPEPKLVRCICGRIQDLVLDLRRDGPSFGRWLSIELSANNGKALYVPTGFAHGFQALEDESAVHYTMAEYYDASLQLGIRWDDPAFNILWPLPVTEISDRDASFPDYEI
jgi:dTDP-4-dehydrorhamnose 3,5-epimerase